MAVRNNLRPAELHVSAGEENADPSPFPLLFPSGILRGTVGLGVMVVVSLNKTTKNSFNFET